MIGMNGNYGFRTFERPQLKTLEEPPIEEPVIEDTVPEGRSSGNKPDDNPPLLDVSIEDIDPAILLKMKGVVFNNFSPNAKPPEEKLHNKADDAGLIRVDCFEPQTPEEATSEWLKNGIEQETYERFFETTYDEELEYYVVTPKEPFIMTDYNSVGADSKFGSSTTITLYNTEEGTYVKISGAEASQEDIIQYQDSNGNLIKTEIVNPRNEMWQRRI